MGVVQLREGQRFVDSSTLLTECNSYGVTDEHLPGGHDGEVGDVDQHVDDRHHGDGDTDGEGQVHLVDLILRLDIKIYNTGVLQFTDQCP